MTIRAGIDDVAVIGINQDHVDIGVDTDGLPGGTRIDRFEGALSRGAGIQNVAVVRVDGYREYQCVAQAVGHIRPGGAAVCGFQQVIDGTGSTVHHVRVVRVHDQGQAAPATAGPVGAAVNRLVETVELRVDIDHVRIAGRHDQARDSAPGRKSGIDRSERGTAICALDDPAARSADIDRVRAGIRGDVRLDRRRCRSDRAPADGPSNPRFG